MTLIVKQTRNLRRELRALRSVSTCKNVIVLDCYVLKVI